jgi:hypothetical protein
MNASRKLDIREAEVAKPPEWTKHYAGPCPVLPDTIVSVRWRNGEVSKHTYQAKQLRWQRFPRGETPFDIVDFRI